MTDERSERLRRRIQRRKQRVQGLEQTSGWACGIGSCTFTSEAIEELIIHQSRDHPVHTCKVCDRDFPDGFIAIYHTFEKHSRTEYVKAYDASPDDVRQREKIKEEIEQYIDVPSVLRTLNSHLTTQYP